MVDGVEGRSDGENARVWRQRWTSEVAWIASLLHAADEAGVAQYWRSANKHGRKKVVESLLRENLAKAVPVCHEELPHGRQLLQRVESIVRVWRGGEARKAELGELRWAAALAAQRDNPPLRRHQAGYTQWLQVRKYLCMLGWVGVQFEEGDARQPTSETEKLIRRVTPLLSALDAALAHDNEQRDAKRRGDGRETAQAEEAGDVQGVASERVDLGVSKRGERPHAALGHQGNGIPSGGRLPVTDRNIPQATEEVVQTFRLGDIVSDLTEEEAALLMRCTPENFKDFPVVDLEATELPAPWSVLDFRTVTVLDEKRWEMYGTLLMAWGLLQQGEEANREKVALASYDIVEKLASFPRRIFPNQIATAEEVEKFRERRERTIRSKAAELRAMQPEEQLKRVELSAQHVSLIARRCVERRCSRR